MTQLSHKARRAVLFMPANNDRALSKIGQLACDGVIIDLEDAVAPDDKEAARERLIRLFAEREPDGREWVIRVNALSSQWGPDDLVVACRCRPDAILLPKVETAQDIMDADASLDGMKAASAMQLWAMIETPRAMMEIGSIVELPRERRSRLSCLVAGTNDLVKETGILARSDRRHLQSWLLQIVLAARAGRIDALDGVSNNFRDLGIFAEECRQGAELGFDGKTLIHPAQIDAALNAFTPSPEAVDEALAIRTAFARPENAGKGVISLEGRMVERLHLKQAERLLAKAGYGEGTA